MLNVYLSSSEKTCSISNVLYVNYSHKGEWIANSAQTAVVFKCTHEFLSFKKMVIRKVSFVITLISFTINLSYLVYYEIAFKEVNTIKYSVKDL